MVGFMFSRVFASVLLTVGLLAAGCVSQSKYAALQAQLAAAQAKQAETEQRLVISNDQIALLRRQVAALSLTSGLPMPAVPVRNKEEPPLPVTLSFHRLPDRGGFQVSLATRTGTRFGVRVAVIDPPSGRRRRFRVFIPPDAPFVLASENPSEPVVVNPGDEIQVTCPGYSMLDVIFHPSGSE